MRTHLASIRDMCEADCQKIDPANPVDEHLDSITFERYLRQNGASETAVSTSTIWTRAMLGQEPSDISALCFLTYCKAGGGLLQMRSDREGGAQFLRVRQGTQSFANGLASTLSEGTIKLSTVVQAVSQETSDRVIISMSGGTYACQRLIMSLPGPVYKTVDFSPPLPLTKSLLHEQYTYGYYTKVMMVFKIPFWTKKNFCGLAKSFSGPASVIRDTSIPADDKWVLICCLAGETGRAWSEQSPASREAQLLDQIGQIYGSKSEANSSFVLSMGHEWTTEQYSGWGCPCTSLPPGVLDAVGHSITEPFARIHFVGTETAPGWKGYMEGALMSGERGASEVIKKIKNVMARLWSHDLMLVLGERSGCVAKVANPFNYAWCSAFDWPSF